MNYYIRGDAAKAGQIKAAFEKLGYDVTGFDMCNDNILFFTYKLQTGGQFISTTNANLYTAEIIKTHPDYKELELPAKAKFKEEDWIVQNDNGTVSQIIKVINDTDEYGKYRAYEHTNGYFAACFENEYHLWSIQDAKDGDVITNGKLIVIFNKLEEPTYRQHIIAYVGLDLCGRLQITEDTWQLGVGKAIPATKEQRDLLFAKIKEAGYEWNADKKELRKIQPHYDIANFKPFDKVLVRDRNDEPWRIAFYGYYNEEAHYSHFVGTCWSKQCIPFNDDTKHLLGTTDPCDERFINW